MVIKGVICDLDGTLVDSEDLHDKAWDDLIRGYGVTPPPHWHDDTVGLPDYYARDKIHAMFPAIAATGDDLLELKQVAFRGLVAEKGLRLAFPGVSERLDALTDRGIRLAVGTNSRLINTEASLEAAGLRRHFAAISTIDMVENGKPAPDIYRLAAEKLGLPPAECVVLEDSPAGLQAARAAGCAAFALSTTMPVEMLTPRDRLFSGTAEALDWVLDQQR